MKLLTAASNGEPERNNSTEGGPKEDSDVIVALQSCANDSSHSPHMTPALAAQAPQESVAAVGGKSATLARSALMISESNDA